MDRARHRGAVAAMTSTAPRVADRVPRVARVERGGTDMRRVSRRAVGTFVVLGSLAFAPGAGAQSGSEVVTLDRDLVRLNTSNPPGNEGQVANYMRDRLA